MISLGDIRDLVSSLFIMLNKKTFILFRIEFLVVLVTLLFLAMFVMDIFRRHIHSSVMKAIFSNFDAISDSIVIYLLGAMQTASFKNGLFPVWALVLVIFRYNVDFISGYGVPDNGGRRFTEWRNVVKLLGSAFLNWTRGSRFARPLWSLWALQILRSWYRFHTRTLAFNSIWHGESSGLISEYMRADHHPNKWKPEECNPETMDGYQYLVYGERCELQKPRYVLTVAQQTPKRIREDTTGKTITRSSPITLDKIWGCCRHLLCSRDDKDLKDLSLAFALSRLLRCRLEDVTLQRDIFCINRKLVKTKIIEEKDPKRAFGVMELQLAFVNDYFNTRYPMVFWSGLLSLFFNLLLSMVNLCVVLWLSVSILKVYEPPEGELAHVVRGFNVDMIITWVFMVFMMFKEIWEMVIYLLSDWTRLLLVCMYAGWDDELNRNLYMERLILFFFRSKIIAKRWHGLMDQYNFVQSYDHRPNFWNLIHKLTTGMVPKKDDGAKLSSAVDVPEYVWPAILEKLRTILNKAETADPNRNSEEPVILRLPKVITTLSSDSRERLYGWACYNLPTSSHIILVWHIATSLCEMKLAQEKGMDLNNPGFLCSLLSWFTRCCPSKLEEKLTGKLQESYIIAKSLSRYCAYLLVSKPDLIPDSFLVPMMVFQKTVKSAREGILKDCDSLQQRYDKLRKAKNAAEDNENVKKNEDIVKQGSMLGMELLSQEENEENRWEILAGVWTELLVHIAPTWNAEAHKNCLESGGEFITHIWALLWHCGIEKSSLWPVDDASEDDAPVDNNVVNNNIKPVGETQQAGANTNNRHIGSEVRKDDENGGTKTPEAGTLKIGPRGLEGTRSSEIEEAS